MDSLASYGSDDDDDTPEETHESPEESRRAPRTRTDDTNYDEVQMSLSEGSDQEGGAERRPRGPRKRPGDARHSGRRDEDRPRPRSRSRERYRKERRRSRSPRERRRSRSPKNRSRSRSRDRGRYSKRYEKSGHRDRFNVGSKQPEPHQSDEQPRQTVGEDQSKDRFFMPGITGRFRDQIEKRKLLWQKKKEPEQQKVNTQSTKVWETTTFAQDQDGKVANKFKRLMGIRSETGEGTSGQGDLLKKQEEMFTSMEAQYEVARTATHTMRGVGLGFGSFQR